LKLTTIFFALMLPFAVVMAAEGIPLNGQNGVFDSSGGCSRGYYKSANQCFKLKVPENAKLNYLGNAWVCKPGFRKSGNSCLKVKIPANGKLNYRGDGWDCKRGYYKLGNSCLKIKVPANAVMNDLGNGWVCVKGYKKVDGACAAMSSEELKKQAEREKALKAALKKKAYESNCETEYKTHSNVCVEITEDDFKCKKSFGAGFYRSCVVKLNYDFETDYKGSASMDFDVVCTVEVEYISRQSTSSRFDSLTNDRSHSLDALGNESGSIKFKFPFSSSKEVTSASLSLAECTVDNIDLY